MKITLDLLNGMPSGATACMDGREWFAATFPNGAGLDEFWATCPFVDWQIWFTVNYVPMAEVCNLAYKFAGQAMRFAGIKDYADNVGADNTRAAARAAARAGGGAARDAYAADAAADAAYMEQVEWCRAALVNN